MKTILADKVYSKIMELEDYYFDDSRSYTARVELSKCKTLKTIKVCENVDSRLVKIGYLKVVGQKISSTSSVLALVMQRLGVSIVLRVGCPSRCLDSDLKPRKYTVKGYLGNIDSRTLYNYLSTFGKRELALKTALFNDLHALQRASLLFKEDYIHLAKLNTRDIRDIIAEVLAERFIRDFESSMTDKRS